MGFYQVKNPEVKQKLQEWHDKLIEVRKEANALVMTIADASELYYERQVGTRIGGVYAIIFPKGTSPRGWVKRKNGGYYPSAKVNKESFAKFEALPSIDKQELNDTLLYKIYKDERNAQMSLWPGLSCLNGEFYVETPDYVDGQWIVPHDVVEITSGQYRMAKTEHERIEAEKKSPPTL